jgi:hypothetical protein
LLHLFSQSKDLIEAVIGLDRNVLHVHLGIVLFLLLAWCFPRPGRYRKAFVWLLAIALINESFDAMIAFDKGVTPNWPDGLADIINTVLWPGLWCWFRRKLVPALQDGSGPGDRTRDVQATEKL